jgi:hypothetical protein
MRAKYDDLQVQKQLLLIYPQGKPVGCYLPCSIMEWGEGGGSLGPTSTGLSPSKVLFCPTWPPSTCGQCQTLGLQTTELSSAAFYLFAQLTLPPHPPPTAPPRGGHPAPPLPAPAQVAAPALRSVPGTGDAGVLRVPDAGLRGCVLPVVLGRHAAAVPSLHAPRGALLLGLQ